MSDHLCGIFIGNQCAECGYYHLSPSDVEQLRERRNKMAAVIAADAEDPDSVYVINYEVGYRNALDFVLALIERKQ